MKWGFVVIFNVVVMWCVCAMLSNQKAKCTKRLASRFVFAQHLQKRTEWREREKERMRTRAEEGKKTTCTRRNKRSCFGFSMSSSSLNCRRVFFTCMLPLLLFNVDGSMCICAEFKLKYFDSLATWKIHCVCVPSILLFILFFFAAAAAIASPFRPIAYIHTLIMELRVYDARKFSFLFQCFTFSHHQGNKQHKSTYNEWKEQEGKKIPRRQWEILIRS